MTHIVRERTAVDRERVRRKIRFRIVYVAALMSALMIFVVQTGTRYLLNAWSEEQVERMISIAFQRKVTFQHATWSFGVTGLIFTAQNLRVGDRPGLSSAPFITSDYTEIGVPLLPMLAGHFEPRSIIFRNPTVNAIKIGKFKWNFSDIPNVEALKDVAYLDVTGGRLTIIDRSNSPPAFWSPRTFSNTAFHLERPFQNRTWPFRMSFEMPYARYRTKIAVTGTGTGSIHEWEKNQHQFSLKASNVNLSDFRDMFAQMPPIEGLLNAEIKGQGIPEKNFNATAIITSPTMTVVAPGMGRITIRNGRVSGHFRGNDQLLEWTNVTAQLGKFSLQSKGRVEQWLTKNPRLYADVAARNVALAALRDFGPLKQDPLFKVLGANPNNRLSGTLKITPDGRATISRATLTLDRSTIALSGYLYPMERTGQIAYSTRNLNLANFNSLLRSPAAQARLTEALGIPLARDIALGGRVDLSGILYLRGDRQTTTFSSRLKNVSLALARGRVNVTALNGGLIYDGNNLAFQNLSGAINRSPFTLSGAVSAVPGGNVNLVYQSKSLDLTAIRSLAQALQISSPLLANQNIRGRLDNIVVLARGPSTHPRLTVFAQPRDFHFQAPGVVGAAVITGGTVALRNDTFFMNNVTGRAGSGSFSLNGSVSQTQSNIDFDGRNLDVAHIKNALQALNVKHPLLAQDLLFGKVNRVTLSMKGPTKKPTIAMTAWPQDIHFEPVGSERTVRLMGGEITYKDDTLFLKEVGIVNARSRATVTTSVTGLSGKSQLSDLTISSDNYDLADLHSYLVANSTPATVRNAYGQFMRRFGFNNLVGTLRGSVYYRAPQAGKEAELHVNVQLANVGFELQNIAFSGISGRVRTVEDDLVLQQFSGYVAGQPLQLALTVHDIKDETRRWTGELRSNLDINSLLAMLPGEQNFEEIISVSGTVPAVARFDGNAQGTVIDLAADIPPQTNISLKTPAGVISKPSGQTIALRSRVNYLPGTPPSLRFDNSTISMDGLRLAFDGTYVFPSGPNTEAQFDFYARLPRPLDACTVLSLLPFPELKKYERYTRGITGKISGEIHLAGTPSSPAASGRIDVMNVGLPALHISGITGSIDIPDLFTIGEHDPKTLITQLIKDVTVRIKLLKIGPVAITCINGKVHVKNHPEGIELCVDDINGQLYGGVVTLNGRILIDETRPFNLAVALSDVDLDKFATEAFKLEDEVAGTLTATVVANGTAKDLDKILDEVVAHGRLSVRDGEVKRLAELQEKVRLLNLLEEGLLGLNLSNIIAALTQLETGEFDLLAGDISYAKKVVCVERLSFFGNELRLRARGAVDIGNETATVKVYGTIPRVSKLAGDSPFGRLLQHLTLSNILRVATFGMLDELPKIPLLGKLGGGGSKHRSFEFIAQGTFDDPDSFTESIVDTFKWLPEQKRATPYPVFGVGAAPEAVPQ